MIVCILSSNPGGRALSRLRKLVTVLSMVAVSVVVRCGDRDDDKDDEEDRRSMLMSSAYAEESFQDLVDSR